MTENEAIEVLKEKYRTMSMCLDVEDCKRNNQAISKAITALEEIQQYRALGTMEELRELVAKGKAYGQVAQERNIAISQLEEIGCSLGEKMDEVKEAMEKQRAKKPYIEIEKATGLHKDYDCYECLNCDSFLGHVSDCKDENYRYDYCPNCGQAIDWLEVEE